MKFLVDAQLPRRLWLVTTGNMGNDALEALVRRAKPQVEQAFSGGDFVELSRDPLTVRG